MNFSYQDLLPANTILADVLPQIDDLEQKKLNRGWYLRQVKTALDELNFETQFNERFQDIKLPHSMKIDIPKGVWNLRDIFLFNYDTDKCCQIGQSVRCFHKSNFLTQGNDLGYTARNKTGQQDPFTKIQANDANINFFNIQNGIIMFSVSCNKFSHFRIVYNGIASEIEDVGIVPRMARNAVVQYVVVEAFSALKARDKNFRLLWSDARTTLYTPKSKYELSTWDEAKYRLKTLDKKYKDDYAQYLAQIF